MKTCNWILSSAFSLLAFSAGTLKVDAVNAGVWAWGGGTTNTGTNPEYGQSIVPDGLVGVITAVAAGSAHTLALKNDGMLVAWGNNTYGQTTLSQTATAKGDAATTLITLTVANAAIVPGMSVTGTGIGSGAVVLYKDPVGLILTLTAANTAAVVNTSTLTFSVTGVRAIAAGSDHSLALKNDGTVVAWGRNTEAQITLPTSLGLGTYPGVLVTVPAPGVNPANNVVTLGANVFNANIVPGMLITAGSGAGTDALVISKSGNNLTLSVSNTNVAQLSGVPWTFSSGVVAIAAGDYHSMALKKDGTVVAWGDNTQGQTSIVTSYPLIATLFPVNTGGTVKTATLVAANANIVANMLVTGPAMTVGDGAVLLSKISQALTFDRNNANVAAIVSPGAMLTFWSVPKVKTFVSGTPPIAAGGYHSVLLRTDGTVSVWGKIWNGVAWVTETIPAGLTNVTAIAAGRDFTLALLNTGAVVAWGDNPYGQTTVPAAALSDVTAIAASGDHAVALKSNGTVVAWGKIADGLGGFTNESVPDCLSGVLALPTGASVSSIAAGTNHTVVTLVGPPIILTQPSAAAVNLGGSVTLSVKALNALSYQWRKNGVVMPGETLVTLTLNNVQSADAYAVVVTNLAGSTTSNPAPLTVISPPVITSQPLDVKVSLVTDPLTLSTVVIDDVTRVQVNPVTFDVKAGGGKMSYQWYKNGVLLVDGLRSWGTVVSGSFTKYDNPNPGVVGVLSFTNVTTTDDVGSYTVVATNPYGSVIGRSAMLRVTPLSLVVPPTITSSLADLPLTKGVTMTPYTITANTINANTRASDKPSYAAKGLPRGLVINAKTGVISGKPTVVGNYRVTLKAMKKATGTATATKLFVVGNLSP